MKLFKWLFQQPKPSNENKKHSPKDNTYMDVIISLNTDLQIDISVFINDDPKMYNIDTFDYSVLCGKFLASCFTPYIQEQLFNIIDQNVKDENNYELIDNIEKITTLYTNQPSTVNKQDKDFIKPSLVFSYHKHQ